MMPDQISLLIATPIALAMITAMGILWKRIQKLENRVDSVSAGRLADEKEHSAAYRALTTQVLDSNAKLASTLERLINRIDAQTDILRKCQGIHKPIHPQEAAGDTTALLKKDNGHG